MTCSINGRAPLPETDPMLSSNNTWKLISQWLQFNVLEPAGAPVVLQADVAALRMVFVGDVEFVLRPIRPLVRLRKLIEVRPRHGFPV